jgi:predicted lipoprotein with Yx(FWY)xxD motif
MTMRTLILVCVAAAAALALTSSPMAAQQAGPTLKAKSSRFGQVLFDGRGFVLYAFTKDRRGGKSTCSGACAKAWPPYVVRGALRAGAGVKASLLGTVRRANGARQVTYAGWPLYYYEGDRTPGQILCQNVSEFGGLWLVQRPSGKLVRG